jgi:hypothetical protein
MSFLDVMGSADAARTANTIAGGYLDVVVFCKWNVRDFKWMSSKPSSKVFLFVSKNGREAPFDNV